MNTLQLTHCLLFVAQGMIASEPRLTALDQATGDGDHGIGIKRGFTALKNLLQSPTFTPADISDCLQRSGTCLMTSMGGASGAIFGTLFRAARELTNHQHLNSQLLSRWLKLGMRAVHQRGGARPGDKTMMDALAAAVTQAEKDNGAPLSVALSNCAEAAMQGAERTKTMLAVYGRAKNIGERALGHCDPGAVSMALILQFMSEYARRPLSGQI